MVSPTAIEKNGKDWAWTHPVGTGPVKFASYQRQVSLKYEKFDGYWDKGKPYLDGVEFLLIADPSVAGMSFERGEAHVVLPAIKDSRDFASKGYPIVSDPTQAFQLSGDSKNPDSVYANKKVREAIEHAIDKEAIVRALGYGFWEPVDQICPSLAASIYDPDVKGHPYNPARAKQLLVEASSPDGFKTKIIVQVGDINKDAWAASKQLSGSRNRCRIGYSRTRPGIALVNTVQGGKMVSYDCGYCCI